MATDLFEVRRRAWETRRRLYGPRGHSGSYSRAMFRADVNGMLTLIVRLHREGALSEGQAAKATGLSRATIRALADAPDPAQ